MRGFLSGSFWGLIVGGIALVIAGLLNPPLSEQERQIALAAAAKAAGTTIVPNPFAPARPALPAAQSDDVPRSLVNWDVAPFRFVTYPLVPTDPDRPLWRGAALVASQSPIDEETITVVDTTPPNVVLVTPQEVVTETAPAQVTLSPSDATPAPVETETSSVIVPTTDGVAEPAPGTSTDTPQVAAPAPVAATPRPQIVDAPSDNGDAVLAQVDEPAAETPQTVPTGTNRIRINRPGAAESAPTAETEGDDAETALPEVAADAPAIDRFAAPFSNAGNAALLAVVLLDSGGQGIAASDIASLGMPLTVILDASMPDAVSRMSAYRAAGIEVGFQPTLPARATAVDVEVTLGAVLSTLPETIALFSDGTDGVQGSRDVSAQVVDILAAEGRGLIVVERGLGSMLRSAAQANVPAAAIARDLDTVSGGVDAIERALDQAAFRARQSGDAVLKAQASADILSALSRWAAELDQSQVALAPVSAVLKSATP